MKRISLLACSTLLGVVLGLPAASAAPALPGSPGCERRLSGVAPPPVGHAPCPGVRPGAFVSGPGGGCTLNFVFEAFKRTNGDPAGRFIGTAGHCALTTAGVRTWSKGNGPVARNMQGERIGEFAYAIYMGDRDFSLIRLDGGISSNPRMCYWGGPTGISWSRSTEPTELRHFGQGTIVSEHAPARTALALSLADPDRVFAYGLGMPRDSGSGVITPDGRAVGLVVGSGFGYDDTSSGTLEITRLAPQVRDAEDALVLDLRLLTAGLASVGENEG